MIWGKKKKLLKIILSADSFGDEMLLQNVEMADNRFAMGMELKVNDGSAAVFYNHGKVCDVLPAGEYRLSTRLLPQLTAKLELKEGQNSLFYAQLLFVRLERMLFGWHTQLPLLVRDDRYGLMRVLAEGNIVVKIANPQLFCDNIAFKYALVNRQQLQPLLNELVITELDTLWNYQRIDITERMQEKTRMATLLQQEVNNKLKLQGLLAEELMISYLRLDRALEEYLADGGDIDKYNQQYQVNQLLKTTAANQGTNRTAAPNSKLNTVNIIVER